MDGDAVLVEGEQDRLGLDAADAEAHEVGERGRGVTEALDVGHGGQRLGGEAVGERRRRVGFTCQPPPASSAAATPKPTIAGTSSMPPRRARSCAPPSTNGGNRRPRRTSSAPVPFGPPNLCAVTEQRSAPRAAKSTGACPAAAHASTWTRTPRSRACRDDGRGRLERADLVVGELHRDERGVGPDRVEHLVGVEPTGAVDTDRGDVEPDARRHASSTAECSTAVVTMCPPP